MEKIVMNNTNYKYVIVIPTHTSYLDVCKVFIDLLKKNCSWISAPIILSVVGDLSENCKKIYGCDVLLNKQGSSLPNCVLNATKEYKADYYICMLGDAFFCKPVDENIFIKFLNDLNKYQLEYCSLIPATQHSKIKRLNNTLRYINKKDRYSFNFIAYAATANYIEEEFSGNITDLQFEEKYLTMCNNTLQDEYFKKSTIVIDNIFNIFPGIVKGKWDRRVYKLLRKNYKHLELSSRDRLSVFMMLYISCADIFAKYIPVRLRKCIKQIANRIFGIDITNT
ncbi:hypothetical protein JVI29_003079 [Clostridium perfringens]